MALERKYARQAQKIDTEENWGKAVNFVPEKGEIIVYSKDSFHLKDRIKIGDGITKINELGFVNPGRELRAGPLAKLEEEKLSSITIEQARSFLRSDQAKLDNNLEGLSQWFYEQADIDFNGYVNSIEKTFKRVFDKNYKLLNDNETDPQTKAMILDKSYGGAGVKMLQNDYKYDLKISDYKIGDIFCARYHDYDLNSDNCYYMAFYQGDNTFLLYNDFGGDAQETEPSTFDVVNYSWITSFIGKVIGDPKLYSIYYYVLRPQNIATITTDQLNKIIEDNAKVVQDFADLRQLRNINEGKLTKSEKDRLGALETVKNSGQQLPYGAIDFYSEIDIDVSEYFTGKTVNDVARMLFNIDGDYSKKEGSSYYHTMLVPNSQGGAKFEEKSQQSYKIPLSEYQIGDIFCGKSSGYQAAIYQGNNQFMVRNSAKENFIKIYSDDYEIYNGVDGKSWTYYYVLRPERLAIEEALKLQEYTDTQIEEVYEKLNNEVENLEKLEIGVTKTFNEIFGQLTEEQKDMLSNLTVDDIKTKFTAPHSFINHIYSKIGRSFILSTDATQNFVLVNKRHPEMCIASYTTSSNVGNNSSPTDSNIFQIGDIFLGRHNTDTSQFYIMAVYIGNNTWLHTRQNVAEPKLFEGNITAGIKDYQNWTYYGVYRPELKLLNVSGLGSETVQDVDPDTTFATGWYGAYVTNVNGISSTIKGLLRVESIDGKNKTQTFTQVLSNNIIYTIRRTRSTNSTSWGAWYWVDPLSGPTNVEMFTGEMYKAEYVKVIKCEITIPNSGTSVSKTTNISTSESSLTPIRYNCGYNGFIDYVTLSNSSGKIKITLNGLSSSLTGSVTIPITIWYY